MVSCLYELYLVPFARYSAFKNSVSDHDLSGSPKVKYFTLAGKPIWNFMMTFRWYELYLVPFARYSTSKISVSDLDLSGSPKFKCSTFFGNPIWDFVMTFCWYELYISHRLRDISYLRFRLVTSTFQGHRKSKFHVFWEADMGLHNGLLLVRTIAYRLQDIPHLWYRLLTLTFQGHRRSIISLFLGSRYGTL